MDESLTVPERCPSLYNLYIYATEECNLACKHCWVTARRHRGAERAEVPVAVYRRFIDQAIPLGLGYVKISGGEALLRRRDVLDLIEFTASKRLATRLETNGTLIDSEVADILRSTRTPVSISLDGATAESHERIRLIAGSFDATLRAFQLLSDRKVPVEILFSLYRHNRSELDGVVEIGAALWAASVKVNPIIVSGRARMMQKRGELLTAQELLQFIRQVDRRYQSSPVPVTVTAEPAYHSLGAIAGNRVAGGHCGFLNLLGILADGSVSFCGMGYKYSRYLFGRAESIDLERVWTTHPVLQEVRASIPQDLEGICGNCVFRNICQGGCRSNAFDIYRSLTAPAPNCQDLLDAGLFPENRMEDPERSSHYPATSLPVNGGPIGKDSARLTGLSA